MAFSYTHTFIYIYVMHIHKQNINNRKQIARVAVTSYCASYGPHSLLQHPLKALCHGRFNIKNALDQIYGGKRIPQHIEASFIELKKICISIFHSNFLQLHTDKYDLSTCSHYIVSLFGCQEMWFSRTQTWKYRSKIMLAFGESDRVKVSRITLPSLLQTGIYQWVSHYSDVQYQADL